VLGLSRSCSVNPLFIGMPRKPNYGFEKRRKEQEREKKTEAKRAEKLRRREEAAGSGEPDETMPPVQPPGTPDT
jgi:hypothetical protein